MVYIVGIFGICKAIIFEDRLLRKRGKLEGIVSRELHHMITSAYFTAVFETVAHDMTRKKALEYVKELAVFFNCGWDGILKLT